MKCGTSGVFLSALLLVSHPAAGSEITETYNTGETLTSTKMESIKAAVNDNDARIGALEARHDMDDSGPTLAYQHEGGAVGPLQGVEEGGVRHPRGGSPTPDPLVLEGVPAEVSTLIDAMFNGRRFSGRVLRVGGGGLTVLLSFSEGYAVGLDVPAVGPGADPFVLDVTIDAGSATVGPSSSQVDATPVPADPFVPTVQLVLPSIGTSVTAQAADSVELQRPRGATASSTNPVLFLDETVAEPVLAAFRNGTRLDNPRIEYRRPSGSTAFTIRADHLRVVHAEPDFSGAGVGVELELEVPSATTP